MAALLRAIRESPTRLWGNLCADIRLRNLTIYAQWLSLSAAFWLLLLALLSLYESIDIFRLRLRYGFPGAIPGFLLELSRQMIILIFPYAIFVLELPHYFARNWLFKLSILSWSATPIWTHSHTMLGDGPIWRLLLFVACALMSFTGGNMLISPDQGRILRGWVNLLYFYQLLFYLLDGQLFVIMDGGAIFSGPWGYQLSWCDQHSPVGCRDLKVFARLSFIAMVLFVIAAVLYMVSWLIRHERISSRTCGGTGIEPMALMLPGWGPSYQSVGNEARGGAIRLE